MNRVHHTIKRPFLRTLLRAAMRTAFAMMRLRWWLTQPETEGASAFCLTPDGELVLVYSTYETGWNLPGGGINRGEVAEHAVLRELREELGLESYSEIVFLFKMEHRPNFKRDTEWIFLVKDAQIKGVSKLEIERVGYFIPEDLPVEVSPELKQRLTLLAYCDQLQGCAALQSLARVFTHVPCESPNRKLLSNTSML